MGYNEALAERIRQAVVPRAGITERKSKNNQSNV
jgi:hypothetical protein